MSSLVERLRVRSEKRPLYTLDESDDDLPPRGGGGKGRDRHSDGPTERIEREDAKEDACQKCGENDNLVPCSTCTYAFHRKCLVPRLNITSDKWSCPECVSPLTEMEKILDCEETKPDASEETSSSESGSKKKPVKRYLIKWKGISHLHCTWVSESEYLETAKIYPRLKTRLNNFHKQMDSTDKSDDDYSAIRPEWTTVDRILATRYGYNEQSYARLDLFTLYSCDNRRDVIYWLIISCFCCY
jgi:chromodomain-helicase-DNA-binding protein 4